MSIAAAPKAVDGNRNADVSDRSGDSRTNVDEDTDGSKVKPEGAPMLDLFAEENEPGGYYNPRPPNMPAEAAEAQKVLFGDSGGAGGSSASGFAAEHNPAKKVRVEPPRKPPMPALLELANLIHENAGSLGGAYLEHTHEAQVARSSQTKMRVSSRCSPSRAFTSGRRASSRRRS